MTSVWSIIIRMKKQKKMEEFIMFETTNLLPIRYLQDKDNAKVFLEALLGKASQGLSVSTGEQICQKHLIYDKESPTFISKIKIKINMQSWSVGMGLIVAIRTQ